MWRLTCIKKCRDNNDKITGYILKNLDNGVVYDAVHPNDLKNQIASGQSWVDNLKLTSDGRLIDSRDEKLDNSIVYRDAPELADLIMRATMEAMAYYGAFTGMAMDVVDIKGKKMNAIAITFGTDKYEGYTIPYEYVGMVEMQVGSTTVGVKTRAENVTYNGGDINVGKLNVNINEIRDYMRKIGNKDIVKEAKAAINRNALIGRASECAILCIGVTCELKKDTNNTLVDATVSSGWSLGGVELKRTMYNTKIDDYLNGKLDAVEQAMLEGGQFAALPEEEKAKTLAICLAKLLVKNILNLDVSKQNDLQKAAKASIINSGQETSAGFDAFVKELDTFDTNIINTEGRFDSSNAIQAEHKKKTEATSRLASNSGFEKAKPEKKGIAGLFSKYGR